MSAHLIATHENPSPSRFLRITARSTGAVAPDAIDALVLYEVANPDSVPVNALEGAPDTPTATRAWSLRRTPEGAWAGIVAEDGMLDEDLFGLGVCRWRLASVNLRVHVKNRTFASGWTAAEMARQPMEPAVFDTASRQLMGLFPALVPPVSPLRAGEPGTFAVAVDVAKMEESPQVAT